jgi:hypothetical protein
LLCRRHLRHLAAWPFQTQRLLTPSKQHRSIDSVHHGNRKQRPPPTPGLEYLQKHKPIHTNLYLKGKSHHFSSNKQAVLFTLTHIARALCNEDSLQAELVFPRDVFK